MGYPLFLPTPSTLFHTAKAGASRLLSFALWNCHRACVAYVYTSASTPACFSATPTRGCIDRKHCPSSRASLQPVPCLIASGSQRPALAPHSNCPSQPPLPPEPCSGAYWLQSNPHRFHYSNVASSAPVLPGLLVGADPKPQRTFFKWL